MKAVVEQNTLDIILEKKDKLLLQKQNILLSTVEQQGQRRVRVYLTISNTIRDTDYDEINNDGIILRSTPPNKIDKDEYDLFLTTKRLQELYATGTLRAYGRTHVTREINITMHYTSE